MLKRNLANILSTEILSEINREVIRTIYKVAEQGAAHNTATAGVFDLDVDSNGRWMNEKFKGLLYQIEREANAISVRTRRGRGNIIMCSADVASALGMDLGALDYAPALNTSLNVDDTGNTFAGVLNGKYRVYIDPYSGGHNPGAAGGQYFVMGYKGTSPYDAGLFYCPYVLFRWSVQLEKTPSRFKIRPSRRATAWLLTHSLKAPTKVLAHSPQTQTVTTEESRSRASCDSSSYGYTRLPFGGSFYAKYFKNNDCHSN